MTQDALVQAVRDRLDHVLWNGHGQVCSAQPVP